MKKYLKTHAKHILLCLLYGVLTCAQQISKKQPHLFYTVFPLFTLYYGLLSVPSIHQMYEYNMVEQTVPKWSYLFRMYYHAVLLDTVPNAGMFSTFLLLLVVMWKDLRFLVHHAETRLKAIDEALYEEEGTKKYRICHLHLGAFEDDVTVRSHCHYFNTNVLNVVPHSYQSEESQNAIKNYVEYRRKNIFPPKGMSDWERKMWNVSAYSRIFIQNRDMYSFVPFIYILCGTVFCLYTTPHNSFQLLRLYISSFLILGDGTSTVLLSNMKNDVFVDLLYFLGGICFLMLSTNGS